MPRDLAAALCLAAALALTAGGPARAAEPPGRSPANAGGATDATLAADTPWTVLDRHPGAGEQCLVCGQRIWDLEVVALRYKGRTFHVAAPMMADFEAAPERYFRQLQPRAALFDEAQVRERPMASGWLAIGLYVLIGLVCGALTAYLAVARERPPLPWFFAGLLVNVVAPAALLTLPRGAAGDLPAGIPAGLAKVPTTRAPAPCPACGSLNHPAADRCSRCGAALTPTAEAETARI